MSSIEEVSSSLFFAVSCDKLEDVEELVNRYGLSYSPDFCNGYALLSNAAFFGYKTIVKFLLQAGANVNSGIDHVDTPLHFAAWFGDSELAQWLLDHGALINAKDQQQESPIHIACQRGYENVVKLLLDRGADPNTVRERPTVYTEKFSHLKVGVVAFAAACETGHKGFGDVLDYGVQIDHSDNRKLLRFSSEIHHVEIADRQTEKEGNVTALHLAAEIGSLNMVKLLLNNGASVDSQTSKGSTPLLLAAKCRHTGTAQILLQNGARVNVKDENDNSPLYIATEMRDTLLVRYILQCKPDIDYKVHDLVLDIVAHDRCAYHEMVDDFVEHGFKPNSDDAKSFSFLKAAVQNGYRKLVECLLKHGAKLSDGWESDPTLLNLAVESGEKGMIKFFLDLGCDINAKDEFDRTPISYAVSSRCKVKAIEIVQLLLDCGASVQEAPDLLHKAVIQQNVDVCKILIQNGADVNALDESGMTPLHRVISGPVSFIPNGRRAPNGSFAARLETEDGSSVLPPSRRENIVRLLLIHGADVESRHSDGITPLHWACWQGDEEMVQVLLNNGANVEALQNGVWEPSRQRSRLNEGVSEFSSMYLPLAGGFVGWPQNLSNFTRVNGLTPLHFASRRGHANVVETLLRFRADADAQTASKETALHYAVMGYHSNVVSVLLKNGCDVNVENNEGNTALGVNIHDVIPDFVIRPERVAVHQDLIVLLKRHIIKLKVAGFYVSEKNKILCEESGLDNFVEECGEEVNRMKCEYLTRELNLYDTLDRRGRKHVRNESLLRKLEAFDFGKFPVYESLLKSSLKTGKLRLEMITSGGKWLNILIKTSNALNKNKLPILPNELMEEIVSYLCKKDLNVLIWCGKNLKRHLSR